MQKIPRSQWLGYSIAIVVVYLLGRAWFYGESLSSGLAVGLVIGMVFGSVYNSWKILETKAEIQKPETQ